jgi:hypothetical protein
MLVISTQYMENYGTPEGPFWKCKGGSEYKVLGVPKGVDLAEVVEMANVAYRNDYSIETVIGYRLEEDDYLSEFEQDQLKYDGKIMFPEPTLDYADLVDRYAEA